MRAATAQTLPRGAHLLGSVPLESSDAVFRAIAGALGDRVRRMPDGETGVRMQHGGWIGWQLEVFRASPDLEIRPAGDKYSVPFFVHRRPGADGVRLDPLGYADAAQESYATFRALQTDGTIPAHVRFQVSLPSPLSPVMAFAAPDARPALHAAYVPAMLAELERIVAAIPHDRLAIQWDICQEVGVLEDVWPAWWPDRDTGVLERIEPLIDAVPADVELGIHLCYGDYEHAHFKQPRDAGLLTWLANAIAERAGRPLGFVHLPVPRERDDAAYFAPLAELRLPAETELYLGLLHRTDGLDGARRRIAAARAVVPDFGVATECGLGRRLPETIAELLELHREASSPIT